MPSFSSQDPKLLKLLAEAVAPFGVQPKLLLALSGGPDSMALFYHMLALPVEWGVAHVDHGWREESKAEAKALEERCLKEGIPFYLKTLSPAQVEGNLEEECRKERLHFFRELCRDEHYQAILMGHQQDDQVETILKRVFEGASLMNLKAIQSLTEMEGLKILRPWLSVPKSALIAFLERHQLPFFDDRTNRDPRFLRGRMREQLIPELSCLFGKNVAPSLLHLGKESEALCSYLEVKLAEHLKPRIEGKRAIWLADDTLHPFELRYLLNRWDFPLSRAAADDLVAHCASKAGHAAFPVGTGELLVDRGRLFYQTQEALSGSWRCERQEKGEEKRGWQEMVKGSGCFLAPEGKIGLPEEILNGETREKYLKRLSAAQVPVFLRKSVPCLLSEQGIVYSPFLPEDKKTGEKKIFLFLCFTPN